MLSELSQSISKIESLIDRKVDHSYRGEEESSYYSVLSRLDTLVEKQSTAGDKVQRRRRRSYNNGLTTQHSHLF